MTTISNMQTIYDKATICDYKNKTKCDLTLQSGITEIVVHTNDSEELKHIWVEWRKALSEKIMPLYYEYAELGNIAAGFNNFSDYAAYWLNDYETDDFPEQVGKIAIR